MFFILNNSDNFWNNFSGFFNHNFIANSDIKALNFLEIVKAGSCNFASGKIYRSENCNRRNRTGFADVKFNIKKFCGGFFGREFVCSSPFRSTCRKTEFLLIRKLINLDYNPVCGVI